MKNLRTKEEEKACQSKSNPFYYNKSFVKL